MGIKFLSFHTIPWCFHVMSNHLACIHNLPPPDPTPHTIKLIKSDGHVKIYDRPISASQLMLEFPKHLICHSDSFLIGQKIPALSETDELKLGHKYFLLPNHFFQTVLSFVTIASFAASPFPTASNSKRASFVKKAASCRPFDIHKTPSGTLQIRVSDEFISKLMEEGRMKEEEEEKNSNKPKGRVCTTPELEKDYTRLVGCKRSNEWKPKLETIKEKEKKRFGMKKKKKKGQSQNKETDEKSKKSKKQVDVNPQGSKMRGRKGL